MAGDFGGACLVGECRFDAPLLMPSSTYFGLPKAASYLYGTWRDEDGNLLRALRGVGADSTDFAFVFDTFAGRQLERNEEAVARLYKGAVRTTNEGAEVRFTAASDPADFEYVHQETSCSWNDGDLLDVSGELIAPGVQWLNSWPGGGCFSATAKYRSRGRLLGKSVEGFIGHEIHYMPHGMDWMQSPFGHGREICWQQIANEYDDGSIEQATFAVGADGWGFALVHDQDGNFLATTDVNADAEVRENGYPTRISYHFGDQTWTWRLDPHGERASTIPGAPLGADGTCTRDAETRRVAFSMGNSDWWTDGRAAPLLQG